jgi:hypothetical protein
MLTTVIRVKRLPFPDRRPRWLSWVAISLVLYSSNKRSMSVITSGSVW